MKKEVYIIGALVFTTLAFSVYAKSTSSVVDVEPSVSHLRYAKDGVGDNEPLPVAGLSSSQYIGYVCHNNTLPYVKENIEVDGVTIDEFCSCMSEWTIDNVRNENLHAFALGYHRFNWTYFQRHYANKPRDLLFSALLDNSNRHSRLYNINSDDVLEGFKQTLQIYSSCSKAVAPWEYKGMLN